MFDDIFRSVFDSSAAVAAEVSVADFLLCMIASLAIGAMLAFVYTCTSRYSKSFVVSLALLPAVVTVVIMMVNGNIGAGVAVAGAFNLVRFRSVPGTAKEICAVFLAMAVGLASGMGYVTYAFLFAVIVGLANLIYSKTGFGETRRDNCDRTVRITIPEDLDYTGVFDDLLEHYTTRHELVAVKTTNMGSMYRLTYNLTLADCAKEKEFIDKVRCRNGNLEISSSKQETNANEL